MEVTAWTNGGGTYGVRIGVPNRDTYFDRAWPDVEVEIDGQTHEFNLTAGFWNACPEFRDAGGTAIRDWLQRHHALQWPVGKPPRFQLLPVGGKRFRLVN